MQAEKTGHQISSAQQQRDSRFIAVVGHKFHARLMHLRVLIHGLSGLGLEVAKNLILTGSKLVSIYDEQKVTLRDLGTNFYATQTCVGTKTRSQASIQQLRLLNPSVTVELLRKDSIQSIVQNFDCVVVLDNYDKKYLTSLNQALRQKDKSFILAGNLGLYGYTFVDFGDKHKIFDTTGEECRVIHVAGITREQQGLICLHEDKKHGLTDRDIVEFRDVKGMAEINGKKYPVKIMSPQSFSIGDTRQFTAYANGGMAVEVKTETVIKFNSLEHSLRYPYAPGQRQMPICTWEKIGTPQQLHTILNALYCYWKRNGRLPRALHKNDAKDLMGVVRQWITNKMDAEGQQFKVQNVQQNLIENIAMFAQCQLSPCCSFWGGIVTQEVIKSTGKFSPLRQWLHHEFFEVLPNQSVKRTVEQSRYQDYHIVFGDDFVDKVKRTRSFLIGSGALGCEFIKMIALMGMGSQQNGQTFCSDDDNIEISNLSRQFLFRQQHIGHNKSSIACAAGKKINPQVNLQSLKLRVGSENEKVFNDPFWQKLDLVINAVDNVNARRYVDDQCVWYEKPLFESGTLGTKCHSQIIIPKYTISYNDIIDPPEQEFAICTLKNFPYMIQHTIQWARDFFEGMISEPSRNLLKFYQNPEGFLSELVNQNKANSTVLRGKVQTLYRYYLINEERSYTKCVALAVNTFESIFHYQIKQLRELFPQSYINSENGKPFWSGLKKFPQIIFLDLADPFHLQFIHAASNILATILKIDMVASKHKVVEIAKTVNVKAYQRQKNLKVETDGKKKKQEPIEVFDQEDQQQTQRLLKVLKNLQLEKSKLPQTVQFEKDDPSNYHIQLMGAIANLRARNYHIQEVENFKIKIIAGKIIPATATSTSTIVGAVGIQIIKYLLNKHPNTFKNVTINLALPLFVFNQITPPLLIEDKQFDKLMNGPIKAIPQKFTKWDKIDIQGPLTVLDLVTKLEQQLNFQISSVNYGSKILYASYLPQSKKRAKKRVEEAIQELTHQKISKQKEYLPLQPLGATKEGIDVLTPIVRYRRQAQDRLE